MDGIQGILKAVDSGESIAGERFLPRAYEELRSIAARKMASERAGHTLQPTALVHEAYLRLVDTAGAEPQWESRGQFFAAAAEAMRRILIESVRRRRTLKRGSEPGRVTWTESAFAVAAPSEEILAVDEALAKLEEEDPVLAKIAVLRYFVGMSIPEIAAAMDVSPSTIDRQWRCARAWLYREIATDDLGSKDWR